VIRQYGASDLAGCVQRRRARQTGTEVGVYHSEQAGLDPDAGDWSVVCEPHGAILTTETLKMAKRHAAAPLGWCEDCRGDTEPTP
jgi:hypothetical protein